MNAITDESVAWVLYSAQPPWIDTIDCILGAPERYGARLHRKVDGKTACGRKLPTNDAVLLWITDGDVALGTFSRVPRCRKCFR